MITNIDSVGYRMAQTAHEMAKATSLGHAKDFLLREMRLLNFKYWEQIAVAETFNYLNSAKNDCHTGRIKDE